MSETLPELVTRLVRVIGEELRAALTGVSRTKEGEVDEQTNQPEEAPAAPEAPPAEAPEGLPEGTTEQPAGWKWGDDAPAAEEDAGPVDAAGNPTV